MNGRLADRAGAVPGGVEQIIYPQLDVSDAFAVVGRDDHRRRLTGRELLPVHREIHSDIRRIPIRQANDEGRRIAVLLLRVIGSHEKCVVANRA